MTDQSRNLIIAVVLGIIIVFGSQILFAPERQQKPPPAEETLAETPAETAPASEAFVPITREEALTPGQRIPIESPAALAIGDALCLLLRVRLARSGYGRQAPRFEQRLAGRRRAIDARGAAYADLG
jgi:hypothetical protein